MKIILIDDERLVRVAVRDMIEEIAPEQHEISEAKNGRDALAQLEENSFDLAFVDYKLPPSNGIEIIRSMQRKGCATRWIMLSGYEKQHYEDELTNVRLTAWFQKPLSLADIAALLREE